MITEIEFAMSLGYKIKTIFEMHVYFSSAFLFKNFVQHLNLSKTLASDCFKGLTSLEEKTHCCNILNEALQKVQHVSKCIKFKTSLNVP